MAIDKKVFLFDLKCRPWPVYIHIHSNRKEITNIYIFCHFKGSRFRCPPLLFPSDSVGLIAQHAFRVDSMCEPVIWWTDKDNINISPSSEIHVEITSNFTDYSNEVKSYIIARYGDKTCSTSPQY